jgi:hypothetical protein
MLKQAASSTAQASFTEQLTASSNKQVKLFFYRFFKHL